MTRSTMSPTRSGSLTVPSVTVGAGPSQYPRESVVQVVARVLHVRLTTAAQLLKPTDPRSLFTRAAMVAEGLYAAGHGATADALLLPLDLVREAAKPHPETCVLTLMDAEQQADGYEDQAQLAYAANPDCPAAFDTWKKAAKRHITKVLAAMRAGMLRLSAHHAGLVARRETHK